MLQAALKAVAACVEHGLWPALESGCRRGHSQALPCLPVLCTLMSAAACPQQQLCRWTRPWQAQRQACARSSTLRFASQDTWCVLTPADVQVDEAMAGPAEGEPGLSQDSWLVRDTSDIDEDAENDEENDVMED